MLGSLKLNVLISRWIVYGCCLEVIINYYYFFWGCLWIIPFQRGFFWGYNHGFFVPLLKFMVHGPVLKVLHRVSLEFEPWGPPMWSQWFELETYHTICTLNRTKDQIMIWLTWSSSLPNILGRIDIDDFTFKLFHLIMLYIQFFLKTIS